MNKTKILLVEDNELESELVYEYLIDCDFDVKTVFTATDSISHLKNDHFDILLLDINLPDFTGYEVLKSIKQYISIPTIILSACSETQHKLLAFKYGANDYMVKPIDLEELEARIWLQLGNSSKISLTKTKDTFTIKKNIIYFNNTKLNLTTTECEIFKVLIKNKNSIVSREKLMESLSSISSQRSLDNHIKNIRKKLNDNGNKPKYLKTEYGLGYILNN